MEFARKGWKLSTIDPNGDYDFFNLKEIIIGEEGKWESEETVYKKTIFIFDNEWKDESENIFMNDKN